MASESIVPKLALGCGALFCLLCTIFFAICMSAYEHLGPMDQVVVKSAIGKETVEGPKSHQFNPFKENTWRKATLIDALHYAIVQNELTADIKHVGGPFLLFMGPYEQTLRVAGKILLEKYQYVRLVNQTDGKERVVAGPTALVPLPQEVWNSTSRAIAVNSERALLVMNKATGVQRLVTTAGMFIPNHEEDIVEVRSRIHVLTHRAVVVRNVHGSMYVISGAESSGSGTAFFLAPYEMLVVNHWSDFSDASLARMSPENREKLAITYIDLRARKAFYSYTVRTSDNVKLRLDGTTFWQITDVRAMINTTSDPEGDLWYHARSSMIQAVSGVTLNVFMSSFNAIVMAAFTEATLDPFYTERGIDVTSLELTRYECVDADIATTLQAIIRETTIRKNRLIMQESTNDVLSAKLTADIGLEGKRTTYLQALGDNNLLTAESAGTTDGAKVAKGISSFIDGLNVSLTDVASRVDLYKYHTALEGSKDDTNNLATGPASLYVSPKDMNLKLTMPGSLD